MPYSLIVDILVAILLVVTIGYAIVLNQRLGRLRRDKAQLERLAASFGESTTRAEESILKLKKTAELLQERIDKAQALRDDLAFLIDRGGQAADSLEDLVRVTRETVGVKPRASHHAAAEPSPRPSAAPARPEEDDGRSQAERELLRAIRSAN
ncbi:MAG: hypothetical protein HYW28_10275 [Rhodospirillales bacterium]|nr:hypothetical protein [Rhodospirillales bacterium]